MTVRSRVAFALCATTVLPITPTYAQEIAQANAEDVGAPVLDDIVVTARRRVEPLQSAPLSISAFNSRSLQDRNIQSSSDVANIVPNVQFDSTATESGGGASSQVAIRGIGQTDFVITVEPGVGIYLDGVYVGRSMGSLLDVVDVERVEVLRGPQGTLFGKNTIGGAIQLISKRPTNEPEMSLELITGSYSRFDAKAVASGPLTEGIRARFSGSYQSRHGFMDRVTSSGEKTGKHQGNFNRLSGRLVVEADLSPNLMATLSIDGTRIREQSPPTVVLRINEDTGFPALFNQSIPGGVCLPSAGASRFSNPICMNSQYTQTIDSKINKNSVANYSDTDVKGGSLVLDWTAGEMALKSITAFRDVNVSVGHEQQGNPYYYSNTFQDVSLEQFSQEFQITGDTLNDSLKYTLGLYYLNESGRQEFGAGFPFMTIVSGGDIKNKSYAAYGQATYDLTDALSLTAGMRYTYEKRQFNPGLQHIITYDPPGFLPIPGYVNPLDGAFGPPGTPIFPAGWYKRTSKSATPMASISYKFRPHIMGYATYSQGFKGGGFTMRYFPPVIPPPGVDPDDIIGYAGPEKATTYEVGVKSDLLNRRLRLNVAAFWTDYKNIQVTYFLDPDGDGPFAQSVPTFANAGTARIKGLEVESSAIITDWLKVDGSIGYIDAKYINFSQAALSNFPDVLSYRLANTPKWTYNIGGTFTFLDNGTDTAYLRADWAYKSSQYKSFGNDPTSLQKGYGVLNAGVTYRMIEHGIDASVGVTNLTDKAYMVSAVANAEFAGAVRSRPREWYVRATYNF